MANPIALTALRRAQITAIVWRWLAETARAKRVNHRRLIDRALDAIAAAGPSLWLTEHEVAARYPFRAENLRKGRSLGTGPPFYRLAGIEARRTRVFYRADELDAYLADQRVVTQGFRPNANQPFLETQAAKAEP